MKPHPQLTSAYSPEVLAGLVVVDCQNLNLNFAQRRSPATPNDVARLTRVHFKDST